jgi:alpha-mannosidase
MDAVEVANLAALRDQLLDTFERESAPLQLSAQLVRGEPIPYADAVRGEFAPFAVGDKWGPPWSTTWFHVRGTVPAGWEGQQVVAVFDIGFEGRHTGFTCEALAWREGRPWRGVDPNHTWLPVDGRDVDFHLEASAMPTAVVTGPGDAPSMVELRTAPEPAFVFGQAELRIQDRDARRVAFDFQALYELALQLPEGSARRAEITDALERFARSQDAGELTRALAMPSRSEHEITAVGHAHIDTAWLWPYRETRRKCARTFSTALALMAEYPDFRFACSQAAQYQWMKETYPHIFEGIRARVAAGQWEPVGSMWVEADCNLPSGEALARQFLHGKRFWQREFGVETRELWLPDVFGYPASLPQLIVESGGEYFLTQKLSWNDTNKPAHHTFIWEGIDGTGVFTHFPPADTYNGDFSPQEIVRSASDYKDAERSDRSLYLYGYGDGGGGPTPEMIESAHRLHDVDGAPRVELGHAAEFFRRAAEEAHDLTRWVGELYFELHRGTYTSQARTKKLNRRAEQALREAEAWSVAAGEGYPTSVLDSAWKRLLLNQFHDVLPGSSIDWVYEDAERDLESVVEVAGGITTTAQAKLAGEGDGLVVFNVNSHARREVVEMDGKPVLVAAPPCGWAVAGEDGAEHVEPVSVSGRTLENGLLRVSWDERGLLTSIFDKEAGREVLSRGAAGNLFQLHDDNPRNWDAWDVDLEYKKSHQDLVELDSAEVEMAGPLRAAVRFTRSFGASRLEQRMVLDAASRVIRFETDVEWQEEHKFLKVAFPVDVHSPRATYEIQFGHVERPTHANTSWDVARFEVCAHRWADLGEAAYGVALLNDCKYGHDISGSVMRLSLLRAPTHPDPHADRGKHRFTYALMPHPGDFRAAGVIAAAEDLNAPLRVVRGAGASGARSLLEVDSPQVVVEAIKKAEDSDAIVIRLYESWGGRCATRLRTSLPATKAFLCDLLERDRAELPVRDGAINLELGPFKILTLKLVP